MSSGGSQLMRFGTLIVISKFFTEAEIFLTHAVASSPQVSPQGVNFCIITSLCIRRALWRTNSSFFSVWLEDKEQVLHTVLQYNHGQQGGKGKVRMERVGVTVRRMLRMGWSTEAAPEVSGPRNKKKHHSRCKTWTMWTWCHLLICEVLFWSLECFQRHHLDCLVLVLSFLWMGSQTHQEGI